ncbi:unnamed protein product [Brassica oleracea var. botrytis]
MDRKKEEALVAAEVETGGSEVMRSTASAVEDADDEVDYDDDYYGESDGESGDPLSSDEEEDKEESRPEDLLGLKMAEKQFVKAPITVFWDARSCGIPEDCDDRYASMVVNNIRLALKKMNYHGMISFFGYGDCNLTPRKVNNSICRSGITYLHVDGNGDKYADFSIITAEMLSRAQEFPSPTNYVLISGDSNLSITLNLLKKKGHNILLAQPNGEASGPLIKDASSVWFWDTLMLGGRPLIPNHATSHTTSSPAQPDDNMEIES